MQITCKELAQQVKNEVKQKIAELDISPRLAILSVGEDPASMTYVKGKLKDCVEVGIEAMHYKLPEDCTQERLEDLIQAAHSNGSAIIIQLPVPQQIDVDKALRLIDQEADVDGLKPDSKHVPCTALGVFEWLKHNTELQGKSVVIINRSKLVGRPLAKLLLDADATVTICHSKTEALSFYTFFADIVVTAVGKPKLLNSTMVKNGAIVVDVGISRDENGKMCGDYLHSDVDEYRNVTVTPVPGGVGLLTRAYLLKNVLDAYLM